jgi:hypothetical protein
MKKAMMVITIVAALVFLVSMLAVVPLFAVQATKTTPTTQQQTPAQTPAAQKPLLTKPKPGAYQLPKEKFWGLEFDHCIIGGVDTRGKDPWNDLHINAKVGQPLTTTCYYKVKTPLIKDITEADAAVWGKGNLYYLFTAFTQVNVPEVKYFSKGENRYLPTFTWEDVKRWMKGRGNNPKIWTEHMVFTWIPTHVVSELWFEVDQNKVITEYDGDNNNNGIFRIFLQQP